MSGKLTSSNKNQFARKISKSSFSQQSKAYTRDSVMKLMRDPHFQTQN